MTWEYLPLLNSLLQILVTTAIGAGAGALGVSSAEQFVPHAVKFVFSIALPSLVIKGLGFGIDFYAESNIWSFIACFLILRAIALIVALSAVLFTNWKEKDERRRQGLGYVAVIWLSLTWISTVILGIPICSAVFGDPTLGAKYGILAGISSFIFQLPLQLLFLECHAAEEQTRVVPMDTSAIVTVPARNSIISESSYSEEGTAGTVVHSDPPQQSNNHSQTKDMSTIIHVYDDSCTGRDDLRSWWWLVHAEHLSNKRLWLKIGGGLLHNPVLWAIFIGFVLSLSTVGKNFRCPSETCVPGLAWVGATLGWLGDCVSPLSLFSMGLWMHGEGCRRLFSMRIFKLTLYMTSKLFIVPFIMVGLATGLNLNDEAGRYVFERLVGTSLLMIWISA